MIRNKRYDKSQILENLHLLLMGIFIGFLFLRTTTFQIDWMWNYFNNLEILLLAFFVTRIGYSGKYTFAEAVFCIVFIMVMICAWKKNGFGEIYETMILVLCSKGISFQKIIKVYVAVTTTLLLAAIIASLTGVIENLIYVHKGRGVRNSFGITYPTDFTAHVFYILTGYYYLRKNKITYIEIGLTVILAIVLYYFCRSRLNTGCILLLAVAILLYKIYRQCRKKTGKNQDIGFLISTVLALSSVLCAGFMLILSIFYSPDSKWMEILNRVLTNRLSFNAKGIQVYGISFWGQYIPMQGLGGSTEVPTYYFFLDSSYVFVLLQYGLLVFGTIMLVAILINFKLIREKEWFLLIIISVVAVQCLVEHHMMDASYNPYLCALFAVTDSKLQEIGKHKRLIQEE